MRIFKDIKELEKFKITSVSIGSFDGLHLGHQAIIKKLTRFPQTLLITFNPHPRVITSPRNGNLNSMLLTQDEKIKILSGKPVENLGVDNLLILKFDKKLANTPAQDFIKQVVKYIRPAKIIVGYNHRFGKNGEGDFEKLVIMGTKLGFEVVRVPPVYIDGFPVSSSWIRKEIADGNVDKAHILLGRPYSISSEVISGSGQGRTLGYPTANLKIPQNKLIPKSGVYSVWVYHKNKKFKGMMSIGASPTFKKDFAIEVHILDFHKDLLHNELTVKFIRYIRENRAFNSTDELKFQLQKDEKLVSQIPLF